jgi:hypothetical protein
VWPTINSFLKASGLFSFPSNHPMKNLQKIPEEPFFVLPAKRSFTSRNKQITVDTVALPTECRQFFGSALSIQARILRLLPLIEA